MSNYNNLKTSIDANIKQNGNQEITGPILNSVLNQMVNILGTGYQFAGVATLDPATDPGTPDAKVFYIANGKGTYTNFGGLEVTEDEVVVLYWDSSWHKVATGIASQAKLSELSQEVSEVESVLDAVTIKGKPSVNLFKPTLVGSFFSLYGTDLPGENKYCQIEQVQEGDIFRMYIWRAGAYKPYKVNVLSAWSNGVAIAEKGASSVAEYVVPSDIDEIRVSMNFAEDVSLLCLTKNLENAPSEKTQYEEGKIQIITDASLQKEGIPADAKAVGERMGARIDFANGVDYQQSQGAINNIGIVDVNDENFWYSSPIAVRRGEVVYLSLIHI